MNQRPIDKTLFVYADNAKGFGDGLANTVEKVKQDGKFDILNVKFSTTATAVKGAFSIVTEEKEYTAVILLAHKIVPPLLNKNQ